MYTAMVLTVALTSTSQAIELAFQKEKLRLLREENVELHNTIEAMKTAAQSQAASADDVMTHNRSVSCWGHLSRSRGRFRKLAAVSNARGDFRLDFLGNEGPIFLCAQERDCSRSEARERA